MEGSFNNPDGLSDDLVVLQGVSFARGDHVIFDNIDLNIPRGKVVAVMGPSGTGKTTLLRLISGQLKPDTGAVMFNGTNVASASRDQLMTMRRQMGMLFQSGALFTNLTVFENVAFPLREHTDLPEDMLRDLVLLKLEAVGLRGAAHLSTAQLSGGMAHRVALARALAMDPDLMLYDEPFTGQDPITMGVLVNLIKRLNDAMGLTSIIVSHDVQETASIADYLFVLFGGKVIGQGAPAEVLSDPNPALQQFLRGLPDGAVPYRYPAPELTEDLAL